MHWPKRLGHNSAISCIALSMAAVGVLSVVGCANRDVSRNWQHQAAPPFSNTGEAQVPDRWWIAFADSELNLHVENALIRNFSLAAALQRLNAARALARREASDLLPDVNGVVDVGSTFGPGNDPTRITWGLDSAYQVDLWDQIESRVDAERFRANATAADYQAVALTIAAEVARVWFSLIEAHAQIELLEDQLETNRNGLEALELRFKRGFIRIADVFRQSQLVDSTREQAVVVRARIEVLEHQLAVLEGQMPQTASYAPGSTLPKLPPLPATGLPSELLNRRPDVRRDYLAFVAADRDLASAISAQYPRINLTGSLLNSADKPENLFRDWFASIGGQLIAPLIDGGQRRAEVDRTAAITCQRFNEYGQTMLNAFREVEDNLALERYQLERIALLESQVEFARKASVQLREQFQIGEADFLDVLSAIQAQQRLQRETLSARLELLLIRIALYLALAGDFTPSSQDVASLPTIANGLPSESGPESDSSAEAESGASDLDPVSADMLELPTVPEEVFPAGPARLAPEINLNE